MTEFITFDGRKKIEKQLQELKEKRPQIAERIKFAKELGDLSENAEYTTAKEELAWTESKINRLETLLRTAETAKTPLNKDQVVIGSKVKIKTEQEIKIYTLVGSEESDPFQGLISYQSPLGQALINKKINEKVKIMTPKGSIDALIIAIE